MNAMEKFSAQAAAALSMALGREVASSELELPPDPKMGDFGFPCFKLSKELKKGPPLIAKDIAEKIISQKTLGSEITVAPVGPYVNFTVAPTSVFRTLLTEILDGEGLGHFAQAKPNSRETWVLEFSSPNIAKPFQIYHLRPTALGAALARVGKYRGLNVITINHLGDWGTQYGKLAVAFKLFSNELPSEPTIKDLVEIYVKFHQLVESRPELEDEAREAFLKLEKKDPEMTALWKKCCEISLKEFNSLYKRLDIQFDHIWGESYYQDQLKPLIERLEKASLLVESEGAKVVMVTDRAGKEIPPCILEKKDGATIYATRDVAAALYRYEKFHFDRMTYIVGQEQKLHFQQVFGVLRRMNLDWEPKCEHVPFGLYRFKDAKMSTRKGNFVTLDDMITLARDRVRELMTERMKNEGALQFDENSLEAITEAVALGAVVFHDLSVDPSRDVEFDVERVVDFNGETGPYLQYAHTRCLSILRKARDSGYSMGFDPGSVSKLELPQELQLVKTLGQFSMHLERTLSLSKASQLANYLIDITKAFNSFYRECHVLTDDRNLSQARVMLVEATRRVMARGLSLMGIPLPEKM